MSAGDNRLPVLGGIIRQLQSLARKSAADAAAYIIETGHRLLEAKEMVPHGQWRAWLSENTGISERTATNYMRLARSGLKSETVADLGLRGALARLTPSQVPRAGEVALVEAGRVVSSYRERIGVVRPTGGGRFHVRSLWLPPEPDLSGYSEQTRRPVPRRFLRETLSLQMGTDEWQTSILPDDDELADLIWRAAA